MHNGQPQRVRVTATWEVDLPDPYGVGAEGKHMREDPIGFIAKQPMADRFPVEVNARLVDESKASCGHDLFGDGHCGEMACPNYYSRKVGG